MKLKPVTQRDVPWPFPCSRGQSAYDEQQYEKCEPCVRCGWKLGEHRRFNAVRAWKAKAKEYREAFLQTFEHYQSLGRAVLQDDEKIIKKFNLKIRNPITTLKLINALSRVLGGIRQRGARRRKRPAGPRNVRRVPARHLSKKPSKARQIR